MKMNIMGPPMPRPAEQLRDLLKRQGGQAEGAPMASDVETVVIPTKGRRAPKRPAKTERT
jgi:hypothetical protein